MLSGCGGPDAPRSLTAADVFSEDMVGQTWVFRSNLSDQTVISVEAPGASDFLPAGCVVFHYTKNRARAYWQPAAGGAELRFVLCPQDGAWFAVASLMRGDTTDATDPSPWVSTANMQQIPGMARAYLIIPASGTLAQPTKLTTSYRNYNLQGIDTFNSILGNPNTHTWDVTWRTDSYVAPTCVTYRNWCGNALISEQWEFCDTATWSQGNTCVHERWYFAPKFGLVRVDIINVGFGDGGQFCAIDLGAFQCYTPAQISFERI